MSALPLAGAAALAAAWSAPALAPVVPGVANALGVARRLPGEGVALTFDDGPHALGTPAVLDVLEAHGARATFFVVGEQVAQRPALAREILARGHQLGIHGDRHRNLLRVSPRALGRDFDRVAAEVEHATGQRPSLYRPPYGIFNAGTLTAVRRRGWAPLLWSRWGRDWNARATGHGIATRVWRHIGPGDVVLLHDSDAYSAAGSWRQTAAALDLILDGLAHRGLPTVLPTAASVREALT